MCLDIYHLIIVTFFVKCLKREVGNKDVVRNIYQTKVSKVLSKELFWYKYQTSHKC